MSLFFFFLTFFFFFKLLLQINSYPKVWATMESEGKEKWEISWFQGISWFQPSQSFSFALDVVIYFSFDSHIMRLFATP